MVSVIYVAINRTLLIEGYFPVLTLSLNLRVVRIPQATLQQYLSTLPCSAAHRKSPNPFLSIPWCYLPISSSVFRIRIVYWWHVRTIIIHQDHDQGDKSLALTREVNLATPSLAPLAEEMGESRSAFQSLMAILMVSFGWGIKATAGLCSRA